MKIFQEEGNRAPGDMKIGLFCKCGNKHFFSFEEIAEILLHIIKNEDNNYPPSKGFRGGSMTIDYFKQMFESRKIPNKMEFQLK